jgi:hypothetical protein
LAITFAARRIAVLLGAAVAPVQRLDRFCGYLVLIPIVIDFQNCARQGIAPVYGCRRSILYYIGLSLLWLVIRQPGALTSVGALPHSVLGMFSRNGGQLEREQADTHLRGATDRALDQW